MQKKTTLSFTRLKKGIQQSIKGGEVERLTHFKETERGWQRKQKKGKERMEREGEK